MAYKIRVEDSIGDNRMWTDTAISYGLEHGVLTYQTGDGTLKGYTLAPEDSFTIRKADLEEEFN